MNKNSILNGYKYEPKRIGIWSPHGTNVGITQFMVNFSIYLAKFHIPVSVIEGFREKPKLQLYLKLYHSKPKDWTSAYESIKSNNINKNIEWVYKGVKFYPLDSRVKEKQALNEYNMLLEMLVRRSFYTFISLYNRREITGLNLETLKYIDELWILVGDDYASLIWKKEEILGPLKNVLGNYSNIDVKLIFTKYDDSYLTQKEIQEEYGFPFIGRVPYLPALIKNQLQSRPFIDDVFKRKNSLLVSSFDEIAVHALGENYKSMFLMQDSTSPFQRFISRVKNLTVSPFELLTREIE